MPADKKKPAKKAAASRSGSTARRTAAAKTTARKTTARKTTARKTTARKTTARKPAAKRPARRATEPLQPEVPSFETDELDETAGVSGVGAGAGGGPFVLASLQETSEGDTKDMAAVVTADGMVARPSATPEDETPPLPERYPEDVPIMVVSAILAASTFLPWYRLKTLVPPAPTATGFATGTWGPMILFLGLASLAIAVLRRAKVRVGLPIADSHFHEFVGWIAIVGAVIKLRALPQDASGAMERSWGVFVAIGAAFLLAFLAGRMSGSAPFTTIPGWFRGRAGKLGLATLAVVVGASAALGVTLNQGPADLKPASAKTNVLEGKFPACSRGFPRVDDAKPLQGFEGAGQGCVFTYTSEKTSDQILTFYKSELTKAGYRYNELASRGDAAGIALQLTAPTCGSMAIQPAAEQGKGVTVIIAFGGPCPSMQPSPGASPT